PTLLLDPFAGTGSSLAFARQSGIPSVGIELSTLGVLIAKARLCPPPNLEEAVTIAKRIAKGHTEPRFHQFAETLVDWIGEENCFSLHCYMRDIDALLDAKLKRWLRLCVSSALRPCSKWLSGSIRPQIDPSREPSPIGPHFLRAVTKLSRDCDVERSRWQEDTSASIQLGDARRLPFDDYSIDAILTSPPYETMYDYFDVHRLSYLAFGWPKPRHRQIGQASGVTRDGVGFIPPPFMTNWYRRDFRGEDTIEGRSLRAYIVAMRTHLLEVRRVLSPKGVAAYAVANTVRDGRTFSLVQMLASLFRETGFERVELRTRESSHRRILPAGRDRKTGRFSSRGSESLVDEYVIYGRR
ncbi:MAG: hypothetical protein ACRED0_08470, partial [Gammaproteobacteria bacterium]